MRMDIDVFPEAISASHLAGISVWQFILKASGAASNDIPWAVCETIPQGLKCGSASYLPLNTELEICSCWQEVRSAFQRHLSRRKALSKHKQPERSLMVD